MSFSKPKHVVFTHVRLITYQSHTHTHTHKPLAIALSNALHHKVTTYTCCMYCFHNTGMDLQDFKFNVFWNNSVTLTRYWLTSWWWWSVKIETCRSTFMYFMYFNIEISILDYYIVECEVQVLVFVNYWLEKSTVKHLKSFFWYSICVHPHYVL